MKTLAQRTDKKGVFIRAGSVKHPEKLGAPKCDTMFFELSKSAYRVFLRPDELLDIAWVCMTAYMEVA